MFRPALVAVLLSAPLAVAAPPAVGDPAKDFELPDLAGKPVRLSAQTASGPVVLVVLRGFPGYQCPACTRQFGDFLKAAKEFEARAARLVFVYPGEAADLAKHAREFAGDKPLPANVLLLTDPGYKLTELYQLRWAAPGETAYPATFVVGADNRVKFAAVSKTHGGRTTAADVLKAVPAR